MGSVTLAHSAWGLKEVALFRLIKSHSRMASEEADSVDEAASARNKKNTGQE